MPAAMPCKTRGREYRETCSAPGICKTKHACIVEADESTRKRMEGTLRKDHEDHIAGKGINSLNHYNLVHKFVLMPQAMTIPEAKAAVDKKILACQLTKVRNNLLHLCNISHFSSVCCSQNFSSASCPNTMAKRMQQGHGEERIVAKSKPTLNLVSKTEASSSTVRRDDSTRRLTTHTKFGCVARRIDDHWNVDVDRSLSDSWTGFAKFALLNEKHPKDMCGPGSG